MIPTTSALPGSGVTLTGRGPDDFHDVGLAGVKGHGSGVGFFHSPGLYKGELNGARGRREPAVGEFGSLEGSENRTELEAVSRGKADGGRSMERKDEQDGARVRVEGREERELVNGAGTRRGAQWQARGLSGDHRRKMGDVESTARESLPEPVRSRVLGKSVNSLKRASTIPPYRALR